jgi:hypothetical protein
MTTRRYPRAMNPIELHWETWRAVIAVLREKGLPYMLEHGEYLEPVRHLVGLGDGNTISPPQAVPDRRE